MFVPSNADAVPREKESATNHQSRANQGQMGARFFPYTQWGKNRNGTELSPPGAMSPTGDRWANRNPLPDNELADM
jgi:hypothetical protein